MLHDIWLILQSEWAQRALIASLLVGVMCGVLGCFLVLRNMALIGDALSHAVLPGVVLSFFFLGYNTIGFFIGSVLAGLASALLITWIQQNVRTKNDAAVGIVFTAMFSLGVMGISKISRSGGVHLDLKDFLFGNVLGVSNEDLMLTLVVTLVVLSGVILFYRYLFVTTFQEVIAHTMGISVKLVHYLLMLLLSFAIVASLQTVGVILVVAMLITPASTALLLSDRLRRVLALAAIIGFLSAFIGLILAIALGTTPGPAMAITSTIIYLLTVLFSPKKGIVFSWLQRRRLQARIRWEDTLKQSLKLHEAGTLTFDNLLARLGFNKEILQRELQVINKRGLIQWKGNSLILNESGIAEANRLVRAHRLWETYLVQKLGLTEEQIHEDAEKYEHLLTDEILHEVDEILGFPEIDPHGSPIPKKS